MTSTCDSNLAKRGTGWVLTLDPITVRLGQFCNSFFISKKQHFCKTFQLCGNIKFDTKTVPVQ